MAEQSIISIEELEKAIIAVQRGEEPQVDLPPEVVQAIIAAMRQLGNFTPTPEFLQKLQKSLESRLIQQHPKITITIPTKHLKRLALAMGSIMMVATVWGLFGDKLSLDSQLSAPIITATTQQRDETVNIVQSSKNDAISGKESPTAILSPTPENTPSEEVKTKPTPIASAEPLETTAAKSAEKAYSYLIKIAPSEYEKIRDSIFPIRITEYSDEYWLELKPEQAAKLPKSIKFAAVNSPFELFQRAGYTDPLAGLPDIEANLKSDIVAGSPTLFLLQFVGKTKEEWREDLRKNDVTIVGSDSDYRRIIVWATPEAAQELANQQFVRWIGPLHPQYKVQEKLLATAVNAFAVKIIVYAHDKAMLDETKLAILDLDGVISSTGEKIEADHKVTLEVMITPDIVRGLAKLSNVISVYAEKSREYQ